MYTTLDALALTLTVHTKGKGIAGTYTFEIAEQKQYEVLLLAKVERRPRYGLKWKRFEDEPGIRPGTMPSSIPVPRYCPT